MWAKVSGGTVTQVILQPKSIVDTNGIQHPSSIFTLWTEAELKTIGIYSVDPAAPANSEIEYSGSTTYVYSVPTERVTEVMATNPKGIRVLKSDKNGKINQHRETVMNSDIIWDDVGTLRIIESDLKSRNLLSGVVASVAGGFVLPIDFGWKTRDNVIVTIDNTKLSYLIDAMAAHVNNCYKQSWTHKAGLDAIVDEARMLLSEEAQQYKAAGYPTDTTNYPLVQTKATNDLTDTTTAADAVLTEDTVLSASIVSYDITTGWPVNPAPEV